MEPLNIALFMFSTIWVGPFWMLMLIEPFSERTESWVKGNLLFVGPLGVWLLATVLNPNGLLDLFTGNPTEFFDTMVSLLGTETGTVLAWAHFFSMSPFGFAWAGICSPPLPFLFSRVKFLGAVLLSHFTEE